MAKAKPQHKKPFCARDLGHALARLVEGALLEIRAVAVGALAVVGGQGAPDLVFQLLGPAVAVAVPAVAGELLDHLAVELLAVLIDVDAEAFFLESELREIVLFHKLYDAFDIFDIHKRSSPDLAQFWVLAATCRQHFDAKVRKM